MEETPTVATTRDLPAGVGAATKPVVPEVMKALRLAVTPNQGNHQAALVVAMTKAARHRQVQVPTTAPPVAAMNQLSHQAAPAVATTGAVRHHQDQVPTTVRPIAAMNPANRAGRGAAANTIATVAPAARSRRLHAAVAANTHSPLAAAVPVWKHPLPGARVQSPHPAPIRAVAAAVHHRPAVAGAHAEYGQLISPT